MRASLLCLLLLGCGGDKPAATSGDCVELSMIDPLKAVAVDDAARADHGRILACAHSGTTTAEMLAGAGALKGRPAPMNGYEQYIVQYVSEGPVGHHRQTSALLYIPSGPGAKPPFPAVAVNHGTNGVGPKCGPTNGTGVVDYMAQPLVAAGYAVVAVDYFGMGVDDGISPYGVADGEARAILDGVRALRRFKTATFDGAKDLTDELFLYGHSQGGQANLFAHQTFDGAGGFRLLGSVTAAPGLGDLRGLDQILGDPNRAVDQTMVFMIMVLWGHMEYNGAPDASAWVNATSVSSLRSVLHDECWAAFPSVASTIPYDWPYNSYLLTPSFMQAAKACPFDGSDCPGFAPWYGYFASAVPGAFHSDAPALVVQGEADTTVPPATTACVVDRLKKNGTPVTACGYANVDHSGGSGLTGIVPASMNDALAWMAALRMGQSPPACQAALAETCPQ